MHSDTARHPERNTAAMRGAGRAGAALLALCGALAGCGATRPATVVADRPGCEAMAGRFIEAARLSLPTKGVRITSASTVAADAPANDNGRYCKLLGAILPVDPAAPEIRFQVNLPSAWNGKALQYGGGAYNGHIPNTLTWPTLGLKRIATPLRQGYITFASDSGHQAASPDDAAFAMNEEALLNFGYMHIRKTRDAMVALAQIMTGEAPRRIYFQGGSTGGREALTAAMRWPQAYDGIVSNYPVANYMGLRLWGVALGHAIYKQGSEGWIPPDMVRRIAASAMAQCDGLDGVVDGLISHMQACRAESARLIASLACKQGETGHPPHCLTPAQIGKTLEVYHKGYRLPYAFADGIDHYAGYNSLEGILMQIGSQPGYVDPPQSGPHAHHVSRADQFLKYVLTRDPGFNLLSLDIQRPGPWQERIVALSHILGATTPDWSAFAARGGKVLWVQGLDDPSVSPWANVDVFKRIQAHMGADKVARFMKLYLVPGLAHGGGRFSPTWDSLGALDRWVERGQAPQSPVVEDDTTSATRGRTRPLCEYPRWPRYRGSGDANRAENFECAL